MDQIRACIHRLNTRPYHEQDEQHFRQYERQCLQQLYQSGQLADYAKDFHKITDLSAPQSFEDALRQRYFWVPILYKLGHTQQAADVKEQTFRYLLPNWYKTIKTHVDALIASLLSTALETAKNRFLVSHQDIVTSYFRKKSYHAIWQKFPSITALANTDFDYFCRQVPDVLGFRWNMRCHPYENRYDALVRGLQLLPMESAIHFRDQNQKQTSGFDLEPVMKCLFVIGKIPIEVQLLGGAIEPFLCAKGYTDYKTHVAFTPQKHDLSTNQWSARLGMCLHFGDTNNLFSFEQLMLDELLNHPVEYDTRFTFKPDQQPSQIELQRFLYDIQKSF